MAIIFSPVTQGVLEGPFVPRPRDSFVMIHSAEQVAEEDIRLERIVGEELRRKDFKSVRATDVGGTGDYLEKIIQLIRGCGFGVAIFSEYTPAPTLANIFFEVGLCHVFGKPVLLAKTDTVSTPSDFVRTEWVSLRVGKEGRFRQDVRRSLNSIEDAGRFFVKTGEVALKANDYELAFERYRQGYMNNWRGRSSAAHSESSGRTKQY